MHKVLKKRIVQCEMRMQVEGYLRWMQMLDELRVGKMLQKWFSVSVGGLEWGFANAGNKHDEDASLFVSDSVVVFMISSAFSRRTRQTPSEAHI